MNNLRWIGNSDKLTKYENHDASEHHREFVRLAHGIGDGDDLYQDFRRHPETIRR